MRVEHAEVFQYQLPLAQPLLLRSRALTEREGLLLHVIAEDGTEAWGEAAPLPGFSPEPFGRIENEMVSLTQRLAGYRFPASYAEMEGAPLMRMSGACSVSFAIEACYFGLQAARAGIPLYQQLGGTDGRLPLNALLSGTPEQVLARAHALPAEQFTVAKLKVGARPLAEDIDLVHEVRRAIGPEIALRLDANRAWLLLDALHFAHSVRECDIEYI